MHQPVKTADPPPAPEAATDIRRDTATRSHPEEGAFQGPRQ